MAVKYLDLTGLQQVWGAVKARDVKGIEIKDGKIIVKDNNDAELGSGIAISDINTSLKAENHTKALEMATLANIGKVIVVENEEGNYAAGPYIVFSEGNILYLSTSSGDVTADVVTELTSRVSAVETSVSGLQEKDGELAQAIADMGTANGTRFEAVEGRVEEIEDKIPGMEEAIAKIANIETSLAGKIEEVKVAEGDKVLSVSDKNTLSATITFGKQTIDGADYLVVAGKDGAEIGKVATSEFVVDGFLKSVTHEGNNLVFEWNATAGVDKTTIDLSEYIDAYSADEETITMSDNKFSVKEGVFVPMDIFNAHKGEVETSISTINESIEGINTSISDIESSISGIEESVAGFNAALASYYTIEAANAKFVAKEDIQALTSDEIARVINS